MQSKDALTAEHLALHLPKMAGWGRGYAQETTLETSPCDLLTGRDAVENPFGALVYIEWLEMKKWQRRLPLSGVPSRIKSWDAVVESLHRCDDVPPRIRRICAGRGAELLAASKHIRVRPFALFTSAPYRHAPKAERTNWTVAEGTRSRLVRRQRAGRCRAGPRPGAVSRWETIGGAPCKWPPTWCADFGETPARSGLASSQQVNWSRG